VFKFLEQYHFTLVDILKLKIVEVRHLSRGFLSELSAVLFFKWLICVAFCFSVTKPLQGTSVTLSLTQFYLWGLQPRVQTGEPKYPQDHCLSQIKEGMTRSPNKTGDNSTPVQ
jgi:hypothetical protein